MTASVTVTNAEQLLDAIDAAVRHIEIQGEIRGIPMITLAPGVSLRGGSLHFGAKGVRLTSENTLQDVAVITADHEVAIFNDTRVAHLGTLTLRNVITRGQVLLLAQDEVQSGHIQVSNLQVSAADVRGRAERPHGFGVDALQGGFTLWNRQRDPAVVLTAELLDISLGVADEPVRGSGVFVGGCGNWDGAPDGGSIQVSELRTGEIHTDGGIIENTPDLISGAVFVITNAAIEIVRNTGPVTTYGQNDMVLDNWGTVNTWTATAPVTSHGRSGIGFVNFGDIESLDVQAPITTTGGGARGFNLYEGTLREAHFASIATSGDGSVGMQISKPLGSLSVAGDVTTSGGEGLSLVKGVQVSLRAVALSIKAGGVVNSLTIGGKLATSGDHVATLEVDNGQVAKFVVAGGIVATGQGSDGVHISGEGINLDEISISALHGDLVAHQDS